MTLAQVRGYIDRLYQMPKVQAAPSKSRLSQMKMYLNYIGQGMDAAGAFLRDMRKAQTETELFGVCDRAAIERDGIFAAEPYTGIFARPSCES